MKTFLRHSSLAIGLALALVGCGPSSQSEASSADTNTSVSVLLANHPAAATLRKMQTAALATRYSGVRRVEQSWRIDQQRSHLAYRESAAADGTGRFAVEPIALIAPAMAPSELAIWMMLQSARQGFLFRYRDVVIRDLRAFVRNYSITLVSASEQVAGRDCEEWSVQRRRDPLTIYTLAVDRETGLVLRSRQEDMAGQLLSLVEFESIDFAPTFTPAPAWHVSANDEAALPPGRAGAQLLGFEPRVPVTDGESFKLLESTRVTSLDPSGSGTIVWAKSVLTDGLEVVIFLHGGADPNARGNDVIRVSPPVGPWNHVEGSLRDQRVMAIGRVSSGDLLDLMETVL